MEENPSLKRDGGDEDELETCSKKPRFQSDDSNSDSGPIEKFQDSDVVTIKEEALSAEENNDGDGGLVGLREADVGIVEYVNEEDGFQGVLKQRFQDFVVNEQNKSGEVVRLSNVEPPENDVETPVSSTSPVLNSTDIDRLSGLIESNNRSSSVNIMTPFTPMVRNIRRRVCARCQARFTSKSALRRHMAEQHEGRVRLVCLFCDRAFSRKYDLKRHLQDKHTATEQITELSTSISSTSTSPAKNNPPPLPNPRLVGANPKIPIPRSSDRPFPSVQQQPHVSSLRPPIAQPASSSTARVNNMLPHHHINMGGPPPLRLPHVNSPPSSVLQRSPTSSQVRLMIPPNVNTINQPHPIASSNVTQHRRLQPSVAHSQPSLQRPSPSHTIVHAVQRSNEQPVIKSVASTAIQTELPPKSEVQPVPRRPSRRIVSETTTTELLDEGVVVARVTKTRNYEVS
ncbi:uncharacterized protein [Antedon mediterranea]|uniref:uncharacterized protein isoform X3 n=1 Tax=Antedon mediterranea TaxID=105859 RepID=UPI003AF96534